VLMRRARPEHRAHDKSTTGNALKAPMGVSAPRRPHAGDGGGLPPVPQARLPLNEKNLDWWASDKDYALHEEIKRFRRYRG
jgi:hypothetical protein